MAIDTKYQDNVVLKQDAFQNLLTNIKNYPIVDIDYIAESDTDELHGDYVWENYTNGIPCIKITYGDDRTTKGNIIFSEEKRIAINNKKKQISQIQTRINEVTKRKNRWNEVYNQNYAVFKDKTNQLARFKSNFNKIASNKLSFLKAGWDLLYGGTNLNIDDPYVLVSSGTTYNANTVYYTQSSEYFFQRYEYSYLVDNNGTSTTVTVDVHDTITSEHSQYDNMITNWTNLVQNQKIYTKQVTDRGPVLLQELGPQYFSYRNILLNQNPYSLVLTTEAYDGSLIYYERVNSSFSEYIYNGRYPESEDYETAIADWESKRNDKIIYVKIDSDGDAVKTFNLEYSALGSARASMISTLTVYRNSVDGNGNFVFTEPQREVFDNFIDFIYAYNKLVLLDTIGVAGYSESDIEQLKEDYPTIEAILKNLDEEQINDFNWEAAISEYNYNWQSTAQTFNDRIESIINIINNNINVNLQYIKEQIRNFNYALMEFNDQIDELQAEIEELQSQVIAAAADRYDLLPTTATYLPEQEENYYIKPSEEEVYIHYIQDSEHRSPQEIIAAGQMYIRNDRTMYGYKYVKVGSNITFDNTYVYDGSITGNWTLSDQGETTEALEKTNSASEQASGTFRITINKHTYEVPIKGFTLTPSNQPIYIKSEDTSDPTHNPNNFGSINFFGNLLGSGSIVTNNGNILASGGAIAAGTYLALEGYAGQSDYNSAITNGTAEDGIKNHAGFWYDGSDNRLIRTWNISADNDSIGLGAYQFVLSNGTRDTDDDVGIIGNGDTIEFHTGLPSDNNNTNNNLANIKAGNITVNTASITAFTQPFQFTNIPNGSWIRASHEGAIVIPKLNPDSSNAQSGLVIKTKSGSWSISELGNADNLYFVYGTDTNYNANPQVNDTKQARLTPEGYFYAERVYKAVFNDSAECRKTINLTPGHVVIDNDDGSLSCTSERLQPGGQVISDTYGDLMGETEECKTPLAIAGRVLVYTYQPRENYHAGMAVCSAPGGTVDIMTREEIKEYPDCIIGIVSEIPMYEHWGSNNVNIDGRIWIKVK